jgi:pilus assembly protein Flp/PilA
MSRIVRAVLLDESGQGLAEYGLILGLIAAVCVLAVTTLGVNINTLLTNIGGQI